MGRDRRAPKEEYPDFTSHERQRIAALIHRRDHLQSRSNQNPHTQAEAEALTWFISWLKDDSVEDDPVHIATMVRYRDYWTSKGKLDSFVTEELSAVSWAIREIRGENLD